MEFLKIDKFILQIHILYCKTLYFCFYKKLMMISKTNTFFIVIFLIISAFNMHLKAQKNINFKEIEDSLNSMTEVFSSNQTDIAKYSTNDFVIETLFSTLIEKGSIDYPFDSLKYISCVSASDKTFRIFTWTIKKEDGYYENFGMLQSYNPRKKRYFITQLKDISSMTSGAEFVKLEGEQWFGAIYYKIIESEINKKKYYTLLGWNGNTPFTQKKIIDVLSFKANGSPIWGATIFKKHEKGKIYRLIFEYSTKTTMLLNYDKQTYEKKTSRKDTKTKKLIYKKVKTDMIVFDHLEPINESMIGVFAYYAPEWNVVDAFVNDNGKWYFYENIDATNPIRKNHKINKKKQEAPKKREYYKPEKNKEPKSK